MWSFDIRIMKFSKAVFLLTLMTGLSLSESASMGGQKTQGPRSPIVLPSAASLPLSDAIAIGDVVLEPREVKEISLPAFPAQAGKVLVLRFRATAFAEKASGCSFCLEVDITGTGVSRLSEDGRERLIGRRPTFRLRNYPAYKDVDFQVFSGRMIQTFFAPDVETADQQSTDGLGSYFALNVSDLARSIDGNTLTFRNIRHGSGAANRVILKGVEIGWADQAFVAQQKSRVPEREAMKTLTLRSGTMTLTQGLAGGFSVTGPQGTEMLVESGIRMDFNGTPDLIASDQPSGQAPAKVEAHLEGKDAVVMKATWADFTLKRVLRLTPDGLVDWKEEWTNTGETIRGLPWQHRIFLRNKVAGFILGGNPEIETLLGCASNPTLLVTSAKGGESFGITMENDWLRLLSRLHKEGGVAEIYTRDLALPPGASIQFSLLINGIEDGSYWTFINCVRKRWGVNAGLEERPTFWGWTAAKGETREEMIKKSWAHLGPVNYCARGMRELPQWLGLSDDAIIVLEEKYPKLPEGAPPAPGNTPDLDVDAFLTYEHREYFWKERAKFIALSHQACPEARVLASREPGTTVAYMPLFHRWPNAEDVIRMEDGQPFRDRYYDQAYLSPSAVAKGWATPYFLPRSGSGYFATFMADIDRMLDECNADGFYIDEFSWTGALRNYSRYDYSRWDGYSATLDAGGNVVHLKSDNAYTTESSQIQVIHAIHKRGKYMMANGGSPLRALNNSRVSRFTEGGNGAATWGYAHLSDVPMILGNFGKSRGDLTAKNVFSDVKAVIENGCLYSPTGSNLVLDGADNFVSRQYPMSVLELGSGIIKGKQRLITTRSGKYRWLDRDVEVKLYIYNEEGTLQNRRNLPIVRIAADQELEIQVPPEGLVIAEVMP